MAYADNNTGLLGSNSTFAVAAARFDRNTFAGISGLGAFVVVRNSTFTGNGRAVNVSAGGSITLTASRLQHNEVGVSCGEVSCTISRNSLRNNGTAIAAFFAAGRISLNDIRGNQIGIRLDFDPDPGYAHEIALDIFTGNASAVVLNDLATAYAHHNLFVGNGVGFTVPPPDFRFTALLVRNAFTRNRDGVFVSSKGSSLKQNYAIGNQRWGIRAIGAIDLGGNVARGNGRSPQCVGVRCASHR